MDDDTLRRLRRLEAEQPGPLRPGPERPAHPAGETPAEVFEPGPSQDLIWGRFDRRHVTVIAFIVSFGAVIAGFTVLRARDAPASAPLVAVATQQAGEASSTPTRAPTPTRLRVHVIGAVRTPGVVTVPEGARVIDAVDAAGGLIESARVGELNLAQPLSDGQQVVVGDKAHPGGSLRGPAPPPAAAPPAGVPNPAPGSAPAAGGKLNLNTATAAQLDTLPGVGPVTAEKILAWRNQHGRFTKIEELQEVPGIGPKSFADIAPHVTV